MASIKKHAKQRGMASRQFIEKYGWNTNQMAHDIKRSAEGNCPYCHNPFMQTGHILRNITIDIVNPKLPPDYTTNTKWICMMCNTTKQRRSPEDWERYLKYCKEWEKRPESLRLNPVAKFPFWDIIVTLEDGIEVLWSRRKYRGPAKEETDRLNHLKGINARIELTPNPPGQDGRVRAKGLSNLKFRL